MSDRVARFKLILLGPLPEDWSWPAPVDAWIERGECDVYRANNVYDAAGLLVSESRIAAAMLLLSPSISGETRAGVRQISSRLSVPLIAAGAAHTALSEQLFASNSPSNEAVSTEAVKVLSWAEGVQFLGTHLRKGSQKATDSREDRQIRPLQEPPAGGEAAQNRKKMHQTAEPSVYNSWDRLSGDELDTLLGPGS